MATTRDTERPYILNQKWRTLSTERLNDLIDLDCLNEDEFEQVFLEVDERRHEAGAGQLIL